MKTSHRILVSLVGLSAALSSARADAAAQPAEKVEKKELRVIAQTDHQGPPPGATVNIRPRVMIKTVGGPGEKETVAFLGVLTSPVPPALTAQLGLAVGAGLVVNHLEADSPAASVLKVHDILLKLDDQQVVDQKQLSILIRQHKEGDEVQLTYLRGGKQATAKVKLGKHEVPKLAALGGEPGFPADLNAGAVTIGPGPGGARVEYKVQGSAGGLDREHVDRMLAMIQQGHGEQGRSMWIDRGGPGGGVRAMSINPQNSTLVYSDDAGSLEVAIKDGKKSLVAKNRDGGQVFAGPINTPEERQALPPELRDRLEKLEGMHNITFHTDGDFKGAETRVVRPMGRGIALPLPAEVPERRAPVHF